MNSTGTIVGIVGSYRKQGHIDTAVTAVLAAAEAAGAHTEKIYLQDYDIQFCTNCRTCAQPPGRDRGVCVLNDDMAHILDQLDQAEAYVIGAPVNCGNVNALTQAFLERCLGYAYWPWGQPAPTVRNAATTKSAVLVSSSAAPGLLGRWFTSAIRTLKLMAKILGAKSIGTLWIGLADPRQPQLSPRCERQAQQLGKRLATVVTHRQSLAGRPKVSNVVA